MTLFWILATAMVVAVLVVLLRPLLRPAAATVDETTRSNLRVLRDAMAELDAELASGALSAEQHAQARTELQRRVLEETQAGEPDRSGSRGGERARASALALAVAVPTAAVLLYAQLGERRGMDPVLAQPPSQATAQDVETLVQRLADRMKAEPSDPQGWMLLGRAYSGLQRFEEARDAYREAMQRSTTPNAGLLADYADVLAMTQGRTLTGEPEKLVLQALALEPDHLKSLALAGSAAFERGDPKQALEYWTRAKRVAPSDSPFATALDPGIAEARAAAGLPPEAPETVAAQQVGAAGAGLEVSVRLSPALAERLQPGDTLFVFARAAEGPRMPVAIARLPARTSPVQVRLDDSSAMAPQMRLSGQSLVVVGARVSRSGNATPQPGDLEGESAPVAPNGQVTVSIDRVRE